MLHAREALWAYPGYRGAPSFEMVIFALTRDFAGASTLIMTMRSVRDSLYGGGSGSGAAGLSKAPAGISPYCE